MRRLSETTSVSGSDWALGAEARSRALLSEGGNADRLYGEAIERLSRTRMRAELARVISSSANGYDARIDASTRANSFASPTRCSRRWAWKVSPNAPAKNWSPPARPGANAQSRHVPSSRRKRPRSPGWPGTGAPTRNQHPDVHQPRTVEWHLGNVFTKLGITSRKQLR
jgi:hypothetical protein